jgi:hypothetical protein
MEGYFMDTFIKALRIILAVSVITGCLAKAIYDGISGSPLASAIGDGLKFGIMLSLIVGIFCGITWCVIGAIKNK